MDSVNLFEVPLARLQQEAKRRAWVLTGIIATWFLIMGLILGLTHFLQQSKERKLHETQVQSQSLKPKMLEYRTWQAEDLRRASSQCTASRLKALFAVPIKGLYLSSLDAQAVWTIKGAATSSQALNLYQAQVNEQLHSAQWHESFTEGILHFEVEGELAC
jgi:hypothetical protein